ncbi:YafY family protein [soil metagenome]
MAPDSPAGRPPRSTAEAQLERILYILPAAAHPDGALVDDLANALGVDPAVVLRDLEEATARTYHHPGGSVESFSISIEGRRVRVHAPDDFNRPVRLNAREALALGLGLRVLAADEGGERRGRIVDLAVRLESALAAASTDKRGQTDEAQADHDVEYDDDAGLVLALGDDGFRSVIADAVDQQRICSILYLRPGDSEPHQRRIAAYRLVYAEGFWYVAAQDAEGEGLRFFRMDRVLDATLLQEPAPPPPESLAGFLDRSTPFVAQDDVIVHVRYSQRVAPWLLEQTRARPDPDGSVVLRHRVADPRWIVRHVLRYGGDAIVVEPPMARDWVASAARRVLSGPPTGA